MSRKLALLALLPTAPALQLTTLALLLTTPALAQPPATPAAAAPPVAAPAPVRVPRATSPIHVDGVLDEAAWSAAAVVPIAYEWTPGDNVTPPVATEALLTYDGDNLYVAFRCHDPEPQKIRAHLMDRDSIDTFVQDDHVVFLLDTFNDERRAYQFRVNPLGVQADAINSDAGGEDWSFDLIWSSAGKIGPDGYVVEVAIPFKQIRIPSGGHQQTWGIELGRSWPRTQRHRIADHPTDRNKSCLFCQFNKFVGFEGLQPGRNLELDPTVTGHRTDVRNDFPGGPLESGDVKTDAGLTARWGVTPNVAVSAAVNPDFSQVEADAAQLDVNHRFALFFPEKRPFFLEGSDFFATPLQAVFTRTVADPKWGLKTTGKVGANAGGVFVTEDRVNNFLVPSNQGTQLGFAPGDVTAEVARYRRDVFARSTVGVLYAGRDGEGGYHNHVAGVDGFFQINDTESLTVDYLHSDTAYPRQVALDLGQRQGSFTGDAWFANYNHFTRNWVANLNLQDLGEDFRADSGFVPRVDVRTVDATVTRRWWPQPGARWTQFSLGAEALRTEDHHGNLTDEGEYLFPTYLGPWQSTVGLTLAREKTLFGGHLYDALDWWSLQLSAQPTGVVKLDLAVREGNTIDFENNRPADEVRVTPAVELKLGRHLDAQLNHNYQRLTVEGGHELFTANLSQARIVYNFNVRAFARVILQYEDVRRDPALYLAAVTPHDEKTLFSQLLFSYKLNPQTVLFVGYSDDSAGQQLDTRTIDLTRADRTFFVKLGYAFLW